MLFKLRRRIQALHARCRSRFCPAQETPAPTAASRGPKQRWFTDSHATERARKYIKTPKEQSNAAIVCNDSPDFVEEVGQFDANAHSEKKPSVVEEPPAHEPHRRQASSVHRGDAFLNFDWMFCLRRGKGAAFN